MLTSLFHAKTSLVLSSALPVSLSDSNIRPGQLREPTFEKQPEPVVGLLLYAIGVVMTCESAVTGTEERMRSGSVVATY